MTVLGTGHAVVTGVYNTCFVLSDGGEHFLTDGGGGGQLLTQLKKAGISLTDIHTVFVTHKHLDHIMGILWILRLKGQRPSPDGRSTVIYGHEEVIRILKHAALDLLDLDEEKMNANYLYLNEVRDGETVKILDRNVTFFDIGAAKAKQFGYAMELKNGEKFTCLGDEPLSEAGIPYAKDSAYLLHEAFCLERDREIFHPERAGHSAVKDAAAAAQKCHVKNLILYHTEDRTENRKEIYTQEAEQYFRGTVYVPDDLDEIEIKEETE